MNPWRANFRDLYLRHLCRHSQFGINVLHLVAVAGIYIALFAIVLRAPSGIWIVTAGLSAYTILLARNIPVRLLIVTLLFVLLFLSIALTLPKISLWVYVLAIVFWHRFQIWNHRIYNRQHDMSEFDATYRKGPKLALLLSIYELPILLEFLCFDRQAQRHAVSKT